MGTKRALHCSFCRRSERVVEKLIGGPGVFICDQCIGLCVEILEGEHARPPQFSEQTPEELLASLPAASLAVDRASDALREHVAELRRGGVSWSAIGEALGVSRQAAWERFS